MKTVLLTGGLGYIGSRVYKHLTERDYKVTSVDLDWYARKTPTDYSNPYHSGTEVLNHRINFNLLTKEEIQQYDVVVHLAAHSSVPACDKDPRGSLKNNCVDFFRLVEKLRDDQKFLYASSGSVYGFSGNHPCVETDRLDRPIKGYDAQKQLIDLYMESSGKTYYGMRFGTVCGYSPNPRNELLINAMVRSTRQGGVVHVTSPDNYRAVLGLRDLCRAIEGLIESDARPGFYNVSSFNAKIGDIASSVAHEMFANVLSKSSVTTTYSFCLNTDKFTSETNLIFKDTIEGLAWDAFRNDFSVEREWHIMY